MLPLSRMMLAMILAVVVQSVNGYQTTIHVSESISEESDSDKCCVYGNCSCSSLDRALANLTSNTLINITTDMTLSSLVTASDIENVSIIGHNNPTVNCNSVGRIHITFCENCVIQGITWDECGTKNIDNNTEPGLMLSYSSTVTIRNCSFQRSVGQAVVLSKVSGDININDCKFVNNSYYGGHGAAVYYLSTNLRNSEFTFIISNCNFSYNKMKSLVYLENISLKCNKVILADSIFYNNEGVSVYAIHHIIYLNGKILFQNNIAENGAGIYIHDYSTVVFNKNSNIAFIQNAAINIGGAVFLRNHSVCLFDHNSAATFNNNIAYNGGAIFSGDNSNITFKGNSYVVFSNNTAHDVGGAIFDFSDYVDNSNISFIGNSYATFSNNTAHMGGAIYSDSSISFKGNSYIEFSSNNAAFGGAIASDEAILSDDYNEVTFEGNSTTFFDSNTADFKGGAITVDYQNLYFRENATTVFSNNIANKGGAIYSHENTHIYCKGNANAVFSNNTANSGGAIYANYKINASFFDNSTTLFNNNTANSGGAIFAYHVINTSFFGNSTTVFSNNTADSGGAICAHYKINASFLNNSTTLFSNNAAEYGGAIVLYLICNITFGDNSTVTFNNNNATFGATVYSNNNSTITSKDDTNLFFNDRPARWCYNKCLSYTGQDDDVVTVDNTGLAWCGNQKLLRCLSSRCYCKDLGDILQTTANINNLNLVNISDNVVVLSSVTIIPKTDITIIGHNNPTVICVDGGRLIFNFITSPRYITDHSLTIKGITWIGCGDNGDLYFNATDASNFTVDDISSALEIFEFSKVTIQKCSFQYSLGQVISLINVDDVEINECNFVSNTNNHRDYSSVIFYSRVYVEYLVSVSFKHCYFSSNDGIKSVIYFDKSPNLQSSAYTSVITSVINSSFHNNQGVSIYLFKQQHLNISGEVSFENNVAEYGAGIYMSDHSTVTFGKNSYTKFINNSVHYNGAAIFLNDHCSILFDNNSTVTFTSNRATSGTIYSKPNSNMIFKATSQVVFSGNLVTKFGSAIYYSDNSNATFIGEISFENNAAKYGAGIYMNDHSTVTFGKNSITKFINNSVHYNGAAIFINDHSSVLFDNNSTVTFTGNRATNGTIYSKANSNMTFKATSQVMFSGNLVTKYGTAIYSSDNSNVTFAGNASFDNNFIPSSDVHLQLGGTVFTENNSNIFFEQNSITRFSNNFADFGAAIFSIYNSHVIFKDTSTIMFNNNTAHYCGALTFAMFSTVTYTDHTKVTYSANTVSHILPSNYESSAGAICTYQNCKIVFSENSSVTFISNRASRGGAVIILEGNVFIEDYSIVTFYSNFAWYSSGGAFVCSSNSNVTIAGNSNVTFNGNKASESGGAIHLYSLCKITFKDNSTSSFIDNSARNNGGAIFSSEYSEITFEGHSTVTFNDNMADNGGALHFASNVLFYESTNVEFCYNKASYGAGVMANDHCNISLTGNSHLLFAHNEATQSGGAGYFNYSCNFILQENVVVAFDNNRALHGGAVCIKNNTELSFRGNSIGYFCNNLAIVGGGAVKVSNDSSFILKDHTTVKFTDNNAQYGAAIFLDTTALMVKNSDETCLNFTNNIAKVLGSSVYQGITGLCSSNCIINRTMGINDEYIATPPNQLRLNHPAICVDEDNDTQCNSYYVHNIMLGTDIAIPACVLDYYNHSINSTQFFIHSEDTNYYNTGPKEVLIFCDRFKDINIIGNPPLSKSTNFSINISLNTVLNADWKEILVNLIIELSPCHPGFWQYNKSDRCECYNASDIVFCSESSSTIKRNYWFGNVTGKPTVTFCPINYCNFSCCETSNGYYHLSPVRDNQCRLHRSGPACGSCEEGYTLSFDSPECVDVKDCGVGQMILVLALILLYWVMIITAVFAMMHFKVGIGYLYAITYYYSVVDLLNQSWYPSNLLYIIVNIMSSIVKITPQFLGQICFIKNMSGIDQQFIHYLHPFAISLFLAMITLLARRSRRLSTFISKGIIHVICCLLLLSYTSLASTSLLLMRPLIFHDVDKVYTYVSPDVEYFHGRHLAYAIVAMLFTIVIVIGLPLLLTLEPFLNSKINFVKIKPLLDQFQGCYKDKYRYFAAYYMICRLLIITIIIANSSNGFIFHYLLIAASVIVALIHQCFRPYSSSLLNIFDGVILHFLVLVSVLPLVESFDSFNSNLLLGITLVLIILPAMIFITMSVMINKEKIRKLPGYCYTKWSQLHLRNYSEIPLTETAESDEDKYLSDIDDSMRANTTIVDVNRTDEEPLPDIMWCRDPFMEILNEIEELDA